MLKALFIILMYYGVFYPVVFSAVKHIPFVFFPSMAIVIILAYYFINNEMIRRDPIKALQRIINDARKYNWRIKEGISVTMTKHCDFKNIGASVVAKKVDSQAAKIKRRGIGATKKKSQK